MNKKYFNIEFEQKLIITCNESQSMAQACSKLGINHNTFIKHAKRLGCYVPNRSGRGIKKSMPVTPLKDVLQGLYPHYQSYKLLKRLIKEGLKEGDKVIVSGIQRIRPNMTVKAIRDSSIANEKTKNKRSHTSKIDSPQDEMHGQKT